MAEIQDKPGRKKWRRPELRKLPISATANSGDPLKTEGNEGSGAGKGDNGPHNVS